MIIADDLLLTRDEIWISDRAVDEDGAYVFGNKAGIPHKNKRVRRFICFAGIRHQGDPDTWFFRTGLAIHDQNGCHVAFATCRPRRLPTPRAWIPVCLVDVMIAAGGRPLAK